MNRRALFTIFMVVFVDVLGFGLILPLLPYYADRFGATPFVIGLLTASYSAALIVGGPIFGRLSDRYGRKPLLLLSVSGTVVSFLLLGFANSLWMLFVGRILDGLTGGNFVVAQSYIADVTDAKNRARGLGLTGAAFGLGFIFGPALGGLLSTFGESVPAFVAAGVASVNLVLITVLLRESLTPERKAELAAKPRGGFTLAMLVNALREPRFGPALTLIFGFGLGFAIFQTTFSLWGLKALGLSPQQNGLLLGYVGLLSALVQLVLIGPLTKRFAEGKLLIVSLSIAAVGFAVWGFSPTLAFVFIALTPVVMAIGVQNTLESSVLSKSVTRDELGGAFGLASSLKSVGTIIGPVLGGALLGQVGTWAPGVAAGLIAAAVIPFAIRNFGSLDSRESSGEQAEAE